MMVERLSTLVALRYYVIRNALCQAFIKYEVDAFELIVQALLLYLVRILNDAAFQVINIRKTFVLEEGRSLLATDATGAIHRDVFISLAIEHLLYHFYLLAECIGIRKNGVLEMPHLALIVIAHVDENGIRF